jgi:hypothetical protein
MTIEVIAEVGDLRDLSLALPMLSYYDILLHHAFSQRELVSDFFQECETRVTVGDIDVS